VRFLLGSWEGVATGEPGKDFVVYSTNHFKRKK
jgi:hypothetical protein